MSQWRKSFLSFELDPNSGWYRRENLRLFYLFLVQTGCFSPTDKCPIWTPCSPQPRSHLSQHVLEFLPVSRGKKWKVLVVQFCWTLRCHGLLLTRLLYPWNSPGKNTGVGCHSLLQRIFPAQGLNPGLLHCRQIIHHRLSHQRLSIREEDHLSLFMWFDSRFL